MFAQNINQCVMWTSICLFSKYIFSLDFSRTISNKSVDSTRTSGRLRIIHMLDDVSRQGLGYSAMYWVGRLCRFSNRTFHFWGLISSKRVWLGIAMIRHTLLWLVLARCLAPAIFLSRSIGELNLSTQSSMLSFDGWTRKVEQGQSRLRYQLHV